MTKALKHNKLILVVASLLLITFCIPAPSHAAVVLLVPTVGLAIWGATIASAFFTAIMKDQSAHIEQDTARDKADFKHQASSLEFDLHKPQPNEG